jgi:hypothetical protein
MAERAFAPVGVVAFGVSTPFAYWGFGVVSAILKAITGTSLQLHVSALAQLRDGFARRGGGSVVVTSDFPDADLADFVCASGLPLIVFSDDPATVLDWTIRSRNMSAADAARLCSRIYSSLAPSLRAERKLVISGARGASARQIVAEIVEFLWPGRGERLAELTYEHLAGPSGIAPLPEDAGGGVVDTGAALAGYADLLVGRWPEDMLWPLALFTRPDERPWGDPIDLTGPARAVLYGPYMYLPVGDWAARVEFEIDGAVSGVEASTDVRINEVVTEKAFHMPAKGIFAYELGFRVADPHHAVEIRLFIRKSAIEGVFLPRSVRVRPQRRAP